MLGLEGSDVEFCAFAPGQFGLGNFEQVANAIVLLCENRHFAPQHDAFKIILLRRVHHIQNCCDRLGTRGPQAGIGGTNAARALEQLGEVGGESRLNDRASAAFRKTKRNIENRIRQQPRLMSRGLCHAYVGQRNLHLSRLPQRALHRSRKPKRIRHARSIHRQRIGMKFNGIFQTGSRLNLRRRIMRRRRSGTANGGNEC